MITDIIQLKNNYLSVGSDLNLTCVLDATLVKKGLNSNHLYFAFRSEAVSDVFYSTPAPDRLTLYKRNVSAVDGLDDSEEYCLHIVYILCT